MLHFNKQKLLKSISYNEEFLNDLMIVAKKSLNQYSVDLKESVDNKDMNKILTHAHSIKGMAVSMYFERLANFSRIVENKAKYSVYLELMLDLPELFNEIDYVLDNILKDI